MYKGWSKSYEIWSAIFIIVGFQAMFMKLVVGVIKYNSKYFIKINKWLTEIFSYQEMKYKWWLWCERVSSNYFHKIVLKVKVNDIYLICDVAPDGQAYVYQRFIYMHAFCVYFFLFNLFFYLFVFIYLFIYFYFI